jgi:sugar/nucleoside kinase (ribokinase family)
MKANALLEEVRRVKDQLAAEAGYDVDQFFAQLQAWSEAHPHTGLVVRNAEELRRLAAEESALALKDKPATKG